MQKHFVWKLSEWTIFTFFSINFILFCETILEGEPVPTL